MRWKLDGDGDEDGQGALFDRVERHVGRGEFRGIEFLHVRSQRIINTLTNCGPLPFRHTINAYRGCSHACSYCMAGETPILMANGRTEALSEIRVGDEIVGTRLVGTEQVGAQRRLVTTTVLDHWSSVKPAWRVTLEDGTCLVASGDHRFLTDRGWRHVTDRERVAERRPSLTTEHSLAGVGVRSGAPPRDRRGTLGGAATATASRPTVGGATVVVGGRRVVSIEPLGLDLPLFDITTGTGDFIADGVVSHNCFARPTHDYLGLDIGEGFERQLVVKVNAVERVRAELSPTRWAGEAIAMGTNTDPYQRCEGKYRLTRGIVEILSMARNPFSILTKSSLVLSDLDLLADAATRTDVQVNLSIGTLDDDVWRATEPGTPAPRKRMEAVARLNEAGVRCGVLVAPVLPGLSDRPEQLREVVDAAFSAGASSVMGGQLVYLKPGVKEVFLGRLAGTHPELVPAYEALFRGAYAPKAEQARVRAIIDAAVGDRQATRVAFFRARQPRRARVEPAAAAAPATEQLGFGL